MPSNRLTGQRWMTYSARLTASRAICLRLMHRNTPTSAVVVYSVAMKSLALALAAAVAAAMSAQTPAPQPAATTAFTGARVIDGTDRAPIENATMLVRGGRIVAV